MVDDLDRLLSGGAKSAFNKDSRPGDSITGIITDIAVRTATEYGTGAPLTFPDGAPKEQIIVTIKAEGIVPTDDDDDMHRSVYVKGWGQQKRAFIDEARKSGKPSAGDRFTAIYVKDEPSKQGGFPSKVYEYRIQALDYAEPVHAEDGFVEARRRAQRLIEMGGMTPAGISAATGIDEAEVRELIANVPF